MSPKKTAVGEIAKALHVTSSYISKVLGRLRVPGERTVRPQRCHVLLKLAPPRCIGYSEFNELISLVVSLAPMRRLVTTEEVGIACVFLSSPFVRAMTGEDIVTSPTMQCLWGRV
ncbi:MAG: SDR family oxidoreductase [Acetobacteraceae bacterium]|nr:SDR family oxidoreductase [Acetobacteraceae bacterium]